MTYAIISCGNCKQRRIIDRSSVSSKCPRCGTQVEHKGLRVIFENNDQSTVREVLTRMSGTHVPEKKKPDVDKDPLSTLIYKYENCSGLEEKMALLSKGLTDIYGTFSVEDIKKVDEKNASKLLNAMLEQCYIHEVKYGRYCA